MGTASLPPTSPNDMDSQVLWHKPRNKPLYVVNLNTRGPWKVAFVGPLYAHLLQHIGQAIQNVHKNGANILFVPPEDHMGPSAQAVKDAVQAFAQKQEWPPGSWAFFESAQQFVSTFPVMVKKAQLITYDSGAGHMADTMGANPIVIIDSADDKWVPPDATPVFVLRVDPQGTHPSPEEAEWIQYSVENTLNSSTFQNTSRFRLY